MKNFKSDYEQIVFAIFLGSMYLYVLYVIMVRSLSEGWK